MLQRPGPSTSEASQDPEVPFKAVTPGSPTPAQVPSGSRRPGPARLPIHLGRGHRLKLTCGSDSRVTPALPAFLGKTVPLGCEASPETEDFLVQW